MGVTTYGWDASELSATYGLQPFVFDPGEVHSQEELVKEAERKVKDDKLLTKSLKARKGEITKILQECLDNIHEQLEQGEDIGRTANFPLLNPFDFRDLEALAKHDFKKDLHADVVDAVLKGLVDELLRIVWRNCSVENESKLGSLERHNEALLGRMQTLEYHLSDRSRQLSNCRFAYFLEITHLRNQVYIKAKEGEKFEAVEAYFFDPTEFLEEELRVQLNDKINLSVKVYAEKVKELQRLCEDLEMKLETAGEFRAGAQKGKVEELIKPLVTRFGIKKCIDALNLESEREVGDWASEWAKKHGMALGASATPAGAEQLEEVRAEAKTWEKEAVKLRDALLRGQEELQECQRESASLQEQLDKVNAELEQQLQKLPSSPVKQDERRQTSQPAPVVAQTLGDVEQMDSLRKQIARLRLDMEKCNEQKLAAEKDSADQQAAAAAANESLQRLQERYEKDIATVAASKPADDPDLGVTIHPGHLSPTAADQEEDPADKDDDFYDEEVDFFARDYEVSLRALEKMHKRYGSTSGSLRPGEFTRQSSENSQSMVSSFASASLLGKDEDSDDADGESGVLSTGGKSANGSRSSIRSLIAKRKESRKRGDSKFGISELEQGSTGELSTSGRRSSAGQLHSLVASTSDLLKQAHQEIAVLESKVEHLNQNLVEAQAAVEEAQAETAAARAEAVSGRARAGSGGSGHSSGRSGGSRSGTAAGSAVADAIDAADGADETRSGRYSIGSLRSGAGVAESGSGPVSPTSPLAGGTSSSRFGSRPSSATKISARVSRTSPSSPQSGNASFPGHGSVDAAALDELPLPSAKEVVHGFAESVGTRVRSSTGGFDTETQTNITGAWDGGFYLLDFPPTEAQLAIEVELEDLNACAMGNWEATLEQIRASQRPPLGHGSGYCPRGAFLRLFQGTRQRISRMEELIQMADKLKRAELLRMLQGVHHLMESTLPDEDVQMRNAIFGKGITDSNLVAARPGIESEALAKKWSAHASKIINILLQRPEDVELGVHLGRRTFMVGGGAGGSSRLSGGYGGAGGGLAARERKDFSPPRPATFPGLLDEDDELRELASLSAGGFDPAAANPMGLYVASRSSQNGNEGLALSGHEIPLFNTEGNSYMMTGFECSDGPYIMVGGRLVPRGGLHAMPKKRDKDVRERSSDPYEGPELLIDARPWVPDPTECRVRSPPKGVSASPGGTGGGVRRPRSRSPPTRSASPGKADTFGGSSVLADVLAQRSERQQLPAGNSKGRGLPTLVGRGGVRRGSPDRGLRRPSPELTSSEGLAGNAVQLSPAMSSGTQAEPAAEDDAGYTQSLLASSQTHDGHDPPKKRIDGPLSNSRLGGRPQTPADMEEPQAEPAPTLQSPAVTGGSGLRRSSSASAKYSREVQSERDLERQRQQMCAGRDPGPTPGWVLDQRAAERLPRGAGGSHTVAMRTDPMRRTTSAGRLRPGDRPGTADSASKSLLDGVTARRLTAGKAGAASSKKTPSRPGSAVQARRPSKSSLLAVEGASDAGAAKRPAVRITTLPVV